MKAHILIFVISIFSIVLIFGSETKGQLRGSGFTRGKNVFGGTGTTKPAKASPAKVQDLFSSNEKMFEDKPATNIGRSGKYPRMRVIMDDEKTPKSQRGWLKQEFNEVKQGKRKNPRMPVGYDLAHPRGLEASKGYNHSRSKLQSRDLHRIQHKYDKGGRNQITQPRSLENDN